MFKTASSGVRMALRASSLRTAVTAHARMVSRVQASRFSTSSCLNQKYFTTTHEWVEVDGKIATVGITDYAQNALGDIVYVDLPALGDEMEKGDDMAAVESVKAASEIYAPLSGTIIEINDVLADAPETINKHPETSGWLAKLEISNEDELSTLLTTDPYKEGDDN